MKRNFKKTRILLAVAISVSSLSAKSLEIVERPESVVEDLNNLYNDNQGSCREVVSGEPRGTYYCSGVIVRGVSDGDFLPWTFSPLSIRNGGASFSWIRHDVPFIKLWKPAGLILRNQVIAAGNGLPAIDTGFICIYPTDGRTAGNPNRGGCGLSSNPEETHPQPAASHLNVANAWGQCEALGIQTVSDWVTFHESTSTNPRLRRQCSWNIDSQPGWSNAIALYEMYHQDPHHYLHNEMILRVPNADFNIRNETVAFFYSEYGDGNNEGLDDAKIFQRKAFLNGLVIPIVRISASQASPTFSYLPQDQNVPMN